MSSRRAVFFDRDGVLNPDVGYPHRVVDAVPFPDVAPALRRIQRAGFQLVVVSNQSGIGRGYFDLQTVARFNAALVAAFALENVRLPIDHFFICPHSPDDNCACRKPKPGLILSAAAHLHLDLARCVIVGDAETDVLAGRSAGLKTVRLDRQRTTVATRADWIRCDLGDVADLIETLAASALPLIVRAP